MTKREGKISCEIMGNAMMQDSKMLVEILDNDRPVKRVAFNLTCTTRSAMWDSFARYWNRYFGHQQRYTWRTVHAAGKDGER